MRRFRRISEHTTVHHGFVVRKIKVGKETWRTKGKREYRRNDVLEEPRSEEKTIPSVMTKLNR